MKVHPEGVKVECPSSTQKQDLEIGTRFESMCDELNWIHIDQLASLDVTSEGFLAQAPGFQGLKTDLYDFRQVHFKRSSVQPSNPEKRRTAMNMTAEEYALEVEGYNRAGLTLEDIYWEEMENNASNPSLYYEVVEGVLGDASAIDDF